MPYVYWPRHPFPPSVPRTGWLDYGVPWLDKLHREDRRLPFRPRQAQWYMEWELQYPSREFTKYQSTEFLLVQFYTYISDLEFWFSQVACKVPKGMDPVILNVRFYLQRSCITFCYLLFDRDSSKKLRYVGRFVTPISYHSMEFPLTSTNLASHAWFFRIIGMEISYITSRAIRPLINYH